MKTTGLSLAFFLVSFGAPAGADIASIAETTFANSNFVALSVGVSDQHETLGIASFGLRELNSDALVTDHDKWHLGSISKSMTSMLLGTFIAEDRLDVDATLPVLLPHLAAEMHDDWKVTTLRDILEHRSGLPENFEFSVMKMMEVDIDDRRSARAQALADILSAPAKSRVFRYSNIGYTLAGHVAETLGDQVWENLLRDRLFMPLDLTSAGFGAPKGVTRLDQPVGHASFLGLFRKPMNPFDSSADNTPILGPAGTVHMSMNDLLTFGRMMLLMSKGEDSIFPAEIFNVLTQPSHADYAGGLISGKADWAGGRYMWHNGSNTMWYALLVILPEKDLVIAVTTNQHNAKTRNIVWKTMMAIAADTP